MQITTKEELDQRIFDYVQTMLGIEDDGKLDIIWYEPTNYGFIVRYRVWEGSDWSMSESMELYNSQMILLNSFLPNCQ
jgi:hypothetical protein